MLWAGNQTRPDIGFEVCSLASEQSSGTVKTLLNANKAVRKLKGHNSCLRFQKLVGKCRIVAYSDASFGNLANGGSQGAYLVFIVDDKRKCNLISWQSKKIKRIVRSSLAAETLALSDCIDAAVYISTLYSEITYGNFQDGYLPIEVITDNKSLVDSIDSKKPVTEETTY